MEGPYSFGALVRRRRRALDLTQATLARLVGVAAITIQKIEADERRPSRQVAALLAAQLQIPAAELERFLQAARVERLPERRGAADRPLPGPLTRLIGRANAVAELRGWIEGHARLVTLTGAGGTGKTRLALQVAHELEPLYRDGTWLVDLAPIHDTQGVVPTIAAALQVLERPERSLRDGLLAWARPRHALLVLDNFEQVADAAPLLADLLQAGPDLHVLVTSRVPLRIAGEREYPVAPLATPPDPWVSSAQGELDSYPAIALFVERAQAVTPSFRLTPAHAPAVAAICAQLGGLPLAIELAAARIRLFPPVQLRRLLAESPLAMLGGGARSLPERQRTVRATIDWSYALLAPGEQRLLGRMGVFVGGCDYPALAAVCAEDEMGLIDALDALIAHSLVRVAEVAGGARYAMLEPIREYAQEQLHTRGEGQILRGRHAAAYVELAERAEPGLRGADAIGWLDQLDREHANLQSALAWCLEERDAPPERTLLGWRMAAALWPYWEVRGHFQEWRRWILDQLPTALALPLALRARLAMGAARICDRMGQQSQAAKWYAESLELLQMGGERWWYIYVLGAVAWRAFMRDGDRDQALQRSEERLRAAQELGDLWLIAESHIAYGELLSEVESGGEAIPHLTQGLEIARHVGNPMQIAGALQELGRHALYNTDMRAAHARFSECLAIQRSLRSHAGMLVALWGLSGVAYHQRDFARCRALQGERLAIAQALGNDHVVLDARIGLADIACAAGELTDASAHAAQALALARALRDEDAIVSALLMHADIAWGRTALDDLLRCCDEIWDLADRINAWGAKTAVLGYRGRVALCRSDLTQARAALAQSFTLNPFSVTPANIVGHLDQIAALIAADGMPTHAARLWGAAEAIREGIGAQIWPIDRPTYDDAVAAARAQLSPAAWSAAWLSGRALTREQAASEALVWLGVPPPD